MAPDYMTPVGVTSRTFEVQTFWALHTDRVREHLARGLDCLKSLPYVAPNRIGVVGYSLGGYFDLVLAARDDVKGVVSYYGAYHGSPIDLVPAQYSLGDIAAQVRAPVLILHGDRDTTIPIDKATAVQYLLTSGGKQSELVVYPGAEHEFNKVGRPHFNAKATADAQARTLAFLAARLK
jgi:carboxymethylenebutenolidase